MENNVLGEFGESTLFYEEIYFGGIWIGTFLGFYSLVHVELLRRGGLCVRLGGILLGRSPVNVNGRGFTPKDNLQRADRRAKGEGFD
jgi:hypothetical protein